MLQYQVKIEGELCACPRCGRQPKHYLVRGKNLHILECPPCNISTGKWPTLQQAIESWENSQTVTIVVPREETSRRLPHAYRAGL
jgi:Zn ribbon nucleic-acid-binding protein